MTKGVGADLDAPGEDAVGLQGNAIRSRFPLGRPRVVALPVGAGFTIGFLVVGAWKYRIATRVIRELKQPAPARLLKG